MQYSFSKSSNDVQCVNHLIVTYYPDSTCWGVFNSRAFCQEDTLQGKPEADLSSPDHDGIYSYPLNDRRLDKF